jgi:hypothetical protein
MYMNSQFLKLKKILSITVIFINATFVRDAQTIQKFKIIHVFQSSYEWKTYYWLHLNFVRVGKLCESPYTGYFTSDNEPGGIENETHNIFTTLTWIFVS